MTKKVATIRSLDPKETNEMYVWLCSQLNIPILETKRKKLGYSKASCNQKKVNAPDLMRLLVNFGIEASITIKVTPIKNKGADGVVKDLIAQADDITNPVLKDIKKPVIVAPVFIVETNNEVKTLVNALDIPAPGFL